MFLPSSSTRAFCICCRGARISISSSQLSTATFPTDLPFDTHSHLHSTTDGPLDALPPSNFQSLCLRSSSELIDRACASASTTNSKHVISIGLHPWNVSPSPLDTEALRAEASSLILKARANGNLVMVGESGLDYAMLKNLQPDEKEPQKQAQLSAVTTLATLGPPLSLHCVRADQDLRQTLSSSFLNCASPPKFIVLHGNSFKDVGGWLSWERKLKADVRVMFGICSRHVSTKADLQVLIAKNSDLSSRLLLESDGMDPNSWHEEMTNGIKLVGEAVDFNANWSWCRKILESERDGL
ncbi:hypothetical protein TrLO_g3975 [Triparma laevis f. longispina]|uniref:Uncharacterized protein n=1 Tax=Triparma laevis f. longispina TaxID=1714387 RepID=A0A9W7DR93_9STRA|nr:hypothetical protein TrLO_g3975 [Triparma laevis f. longispina]